MASKWAMLSDAKRRWLVVVQAVQTLSCKPNYQRKAWRCPTRSSRRSFHAGASQRLGEQQQSLGVGAGVQGRRGGGPFDSHRQTPAGDSAASGPIRRAEGRLVTARALLLINELPWSALSILRPSRASKWDRRGSRGVGLLERRSSR